MKHGARHTYDLGCRCPECKAAKIDHMRGRYVPSRGALDTNWWRNPGDVDEIAVERACWGDCGLRLNGAEIFAVFCWMDDHGRTARHIAEHLGITVRTVHRWRAKVRRMRAEQREREVA